MEAALQLLPIAFGVFFWAVYHYRKDKCLPEPVGHLCLAFALGAGAWYLGILMYQGLGLIGLRHDAYLLADNSMAALLAYSIFAIGPIEELAKLLPFLLVVLRFKEFDEPIDGIIYASFIALGFSAVENIRYLEFVSGWEALARGFAGPLIHIVFASIWGYYIGRAHLCGRPIGGVVLASFAAAAFMHGIYDAVAIAMPMRVLPLAALLIVSIWIWRLVLIRDLHQLPPGPCPTDQED